MNEPKNLPYLVLVGGELVDLTGCKNAYVDETDNAIRFSFLANTGTEPYGVTIIQFPSLAEAKTAFDGLVGKLREASALPIEVA